MKYSDHEKSEGVVAALFGLILIPLLLIAIWLFVVFNAKYRQCVRLENGLNLGYEAVIDLSRPYFKPIAVPRRANGTPLVRDKMWAIYVTDTTVYGLSLAVGNERGYRFAWRADTGLILKDDDPAMYDRLVAEAGNANWDFGTGSYGTGWLLNELIRMPQFDVRRCPTSLITW